MPDLVRFDPRRLAGPDRLAGIDLARGLAVLGMIAAHLLVLEPFRWEEAGTWLQVVDGRSSILFAVLAGLSISLITGGMRPVGPERRRRARGRLAVRAVMLWALGMLLIATGVPVYVILPAYAILFLLAMPLLALTAGALFGIAAAVLLVMPWVQAGLEFLPFWDTEAGASIGLAIGWSYPFPLWFGFLVAGMAVGRLDLRSPFVQGMLLAGGVSAALAGYGVGGVFVPDGGAEPSTYLEVVTSMRAHSGGLPEAVGSTGFAVAVIALCLLLCRTPVRSILWPLRATGSMPLTAYAAQIVVWAVWALIALGDTSDLFGFRALDPFWPLTIGVVAGCSLWALFVGKGPLETLLDVVTRRVLPARVGRLAG
ncbi:heparan-alpha-glucosaminide N-acetyltransferase domain-containing protein [Microbacterium sp. GXF7504]